MVQMTILPLLTLLIIIKDTISLTCHQCNGWSGHGYNPGKTQVSTCDNRNNQCASSQYCVKIVDPIDPVNHYITYKSDCWFEPTVLINATITQTIANKKCYPWSDGGNPPKTYLYCFCNDSDYCNESGKSRISGLIIFLMLTFKAIF